MSMLHEYFVVGSDEEAAAVLEWPAGPSAPPVGTEIGGVLSLGGIDPSMVIGLASRMDGTDSEDGFAEPDDVIAFSDERWVMKLPAVVKHMLGQASVAELDAGADAWTSGDGSASGIDPGTARGVVEQLAGLARQATQQSHGLYCWVSL
ncbi:MAG: hypothetical protein R2733_17375 [Acidimicrobiales bacterium]